MVRFGATIFNGTSAQTLLLAVAISGVLANATMAQDNQAALDAYLTAVENRISENDLEGAREILTEALSSDLRDESLEVIQSQLRLLESLNVTNAPTSTGNLNDSLTDLDKIAATDLLDSLRVAMENGELDRLRLFTDPTPKTNSLLNAVFENYANVRVTVSAPVADEATQSFSATLEFSELTTKDGNTAFPAQVWKTHQLRVIKSEGSWQKVLW